MSRRISKGFAAAFVIAIAAFVFGVPAGDTASDDYGLLSAVVTSSANASCFDNTICAQGQHFMYCTGNTGTHCELNGDSSNCWWFTGATC